MSDSVIVAVKTLAVALTGAAVLTTAALNQDVIGDAARVGDLSAMGILGLLDLLLIAAVLVLWRALDKSRDKTETRADEARQRYETLTASLVAAQQAHAQEVALLRQAVQAMVEEQRSTRGALHAHDERSGAAIKEFAADLQVLRDRVKGD